MKTEFRYENSNIIINHHNDHIGKQISQRKNFYESELLKFIHKNSKKGLFVDIGANIGNHTCFFSIFCADKVIAIEPVTENFNILIKNISDNKIKNVIAINKPFSSKKNKYSYNIIPHNMGMCNMIESENGMESVTPEDLNFEELTLLKIDCEKMSKEIFNSLIPIILKTKCDVIIEADDYELDDILKKIPYKIMAKFNATPTYFLSHK